MEISDEEITKILQTSDQKYLMHVDDKMFSLEDVLIEKTKIPVRKPTTRGGVYFTDTVAYKIKATTRDMSILFLLPKIMLGPNSEFVPVKIRTSVTDGNKTKSILLVCHVSNTVNTKTMVQLNLILDKIVS